MTVVDLAPLTAYAVLGAIVMLYLAWAYLAARGVWFRPVVMGVITALYLLFFFFLETATALGPAWLVLLNLLLVILAGAAAFVVTLRSTRVFRDARGRLGYRGSPSIVLAWLLLLLLEIYVQQVLLGYVAILHLLVIHGIPQPISMSLVAIPQPHRVALAIVDALFALGTGLAVGASVAIYAVFARVRWSRPHRVPA